MALATIDEIIPTRERGKVSVWAVEDSASFRSAVVQVLNSISGIRCTQSFPTMDVALESLGKGSPPDVLLMDIHLPGSSGVDSVIKIRSELPDLPILLLTINEDHSSIMRVICAGALGYLVKTASVNTIKSAIYEVNHGEADMPPQIARSVQTLFDDCPPKNSRDRLSSQQQQTLTLLTEGKNRSEIAEILNCEATALGRDIRTLYGKLHKHSRSPAAAKLIRNKTF